LFPSTHHSLLADLQSGNEPRRRAALDRFVEVYWKPAYKYIRVRWQRRPTDAEDLTQAFFVTLLERETVSRFETARGSFHNFLRVCIDNFARDQARAAGTARRLVLDFSGAEAELAAAGPHSSPEELFHREWQRQVFTLAIADLERHAAAQSKSVHFRIFKEHDLAADKPSYTELAARHSLPVTRVTNYLAWARRELRRLALERVAGVADTRMLFEP
jgi:RNA polymerase sigma-70 factor (ECF subfamily)